MTERIARKLNFTKKLLLSTAGVLALALPLSFGLMNAPPMRAQAQTENAGGTSLNIEVSVKPSELSTQTYAGSGVHLQKMMYSPDGFKADASLQTIIQEAYGVEASQIAGAPEWIKSAAYDIQIENEAKGDNPEANDASLQQDRVRGQRVLQGILADRFQLKVHHETRELPSYALVVAEGGSRLQPAKERTYALSTAASAPDGIKEGRFLGTSMRMKFDGGQAVGMDVRNASTADLASQLSRQLGSVVVDKTGLTGTYDFALNWTAVASQSAEGPESEASASALFTALQQQLGLKLEPQHEPMQVLVIDRVERHAEN